MVKLNEEILRQHYAHLVDKPFFSDIVKFMTSAPVILQVWEGVDAVDVVRLMTGVTNARQAQPGTIR
jgi:nucleoside-diphosphate kinase